jgi:hypothetical protein
MMSTSCRLTCRTTSQERPLCLERRYDYDRRRTMQCFALRRVAAFLSFAAMLGSIGVVIVGAKEIGTPFPRYVQQALAVAAKKTRVPVLGPLWIPDRSAANSRLNPAHGTFAAALQLVRTHYRFLGTTSRTSPLLITPRSPRTPRTLSMLRCSP